MIEAGAGDARRRCPTPLFTEAGATHRRPVGRRGGRSRWRRRARARPRSLGEGPVADRLPRARSPTPTGIERLAATGRRPRSRWRRSRASRRAQSMDALSSQATVSGYLAVLIAADELAALLPDADDRRGHDPARAGARARRRRRRPAGDRHRPPARRGRDRVRRPHRRQGADPVAGREVLRGRGHRRRRGRAAATPASSRRRSRRHSARRCTVQMAQAPTSIITTALVPGRPAPKLITAEAVANMSPARVIVDLAAEAGGNCEVHQAGRDYTTDERRDDRRPPQPPERAWPSTRRSSTRAT